MKVKEKLDEMRGEIDARERAERESRRDMDKAANQLAVQAHREVLQEAKILQERVAYDVGVGVAAVKGADSRDVNREYGERSIFLINPGGRRVHVVSHRVPGLLLEGFRIAENQDALDESEESEIARMEHELKKRRDELAAREKRKRLQELLAQKQEEMEALDAELGLEDEEGADDEER